MNIRILERINQEIIHFYSDRYLVSSRHIRLSIKIDSETIQLKMSSNYIDFFGFSRILRRLLRLDKCNVQPINNDFTRFLVIRLGKVYILDLESKKFSFKFNLKNCRNVLHNSICVTPDGKIIFGEYGANNNFGPVPIHSSDDEGITWQETNFFSDGDIKHIHNVSHDKYEDVLWITTGDFKGQCKLLKCTHNLELLDELGDGSQDWRTCGLFFEENYIYWLMDSPNEMASVVEMDRKTNKIKKIAPLDGPVWYIKRLKNNIKIAGVSVEPGRNVNTSSAQLLVSKDYYKWEVAAELPKDKWTMKYFKFGVISFSEGEQSSDSFYISGEALKELDGESIRVSLDNF